MYWVALLYSCEYTTKECHMIVPTAPLHPTIHPTHLTHPIHPNNRTLRLPAVRQYMGLPPLGQPPPWLTTLPSVNTMTDHTPHDTANVQYTHTIYPHNMQYTHNTNTPSNTFHPGALPPGEHTTPTQHETPPQHTKLTITCYDPEAAARSAVDPMVEAFAANEHDVDSLFWKAAELRALGKLADALHVLQRILHLQPSNARALFAQGQILSRARRWQESCASFSASARVQEDGVQRARAWLGAGVAAKMGGEDGVALDALDRAERLLMEIAGGREGGGGGDVGTSGVGTTHQHDDDGGMQKQHHDDAVHAGVPAGVAGLLMHVHMTRAAVLKGRGDGAAADGIVAEIAKNHPEVCGGGCLCMWGGNVCALQAVCGDLHVLVQHVCTTKIQCGSPPSQAYRALGKAVDEHQ